MSTLECTYATLSPFFYERVRPIPVERPEIRLFNLPLAKSIGLEQLLDRSDLLSGNTLISGAPEPISQAYAGHQFGHFTKLGDGRAHLLGEVLLKDGRRFDLQLKGAGRTPFSRQGDGRAALGPMLREYLISEAMHALQIPTTRSLAVVTTGEPVFRERPLPGAILARVAQSHLRVGTFEYALAFGSPALLKEIADYTIQRHFPELSSSPHPYRSLLNKIIHLQAHLISEWMRVGFIHGVMNTDNVSLSGETIDYGPCAFMDAFDPATVFSSIDEQGRYAFGNQPQIAHWNCVRFAESLIPLLASSESEALEIARAEVDVFPNIFQEHWNSVMKPKLGFSAQSVISNSEFETLIQSLLTLMHREQLDYTNTFRALSEHPIVSGSAVFTSDDFLKWSTDWHALLKKYGITWSEASLTMQAANPALIPRNHLVERALTQASASNDDTLFLELLSVLQKPYASINEQTKAFAAPPEPHERVYQTFCGT